MRRVPTTNRRFGSWQRGLANPHRRIGEAEPSAELQQLLVQVAAVSLFALAIAGLSLVSGTSPDYVLCELLSLLLLIPLLVVIRRIDACTGSIVLASFLKLFWISQVMIIFFWRPADQSLQQPLRTVMAITTGAAAAIVGIVAATALLRALPRLRALLAVSRLDQLKALGFSSAVVGLTTQAVWGFLSSSMATASSLNIGSLTSGLVVLSYFTPLTMLSISCFAAIALIKSGGHKLFSKPLVIVLLIYMLEVAPLGVKTAPLKPLIALAATALAFRWKPTPVPLLGGLALLLIVAEFLYPTVNVARLKAMESHRMLPAVLVEETVASLTDPAHFATIKAKSESYEREIGQSYFGRPVGFLDRFTPLTTDRLVTASDIAPAQGTQAYLAEAVSGLMPRTFGFERNMTARQAMLEAGITRKRMENGKVGWDNTGFVADAYFSGGLTTVAVTFFVFALILSVLSRLTFGSGQGSVIWIPYFVEYMFAPADVTLSAIAPGLMWMWIFLSGAIFVLIRMTRTPLPAKSR